MTDWTSLTYVVVDVEGNGQQPPDLVELATVRIEKGVIGEPVSWLVRPETPITPMARRIHGISNEQVAEAPLFVEVQDEVRGALTDAVLIGHNVRVDLAVLERQLDSWSRPEAFDTLTLARRLLPNLHSYKLGALVEVLDLARDLPAGLTPHRATYDVLVTARLFIRMVTLPDTRPLSLEVLRGDPPGGGQDDAQTLF
jgi:exodeoxyribonuclease X